MVLCGCYGYYAMQLNWMPSQSLDVQQFRHITQGQQPRVTRSIANEYTNNRSDARQPQNKVLSAMVQFERHHC